MKLKSFFFLALPPPFSQGNNNKLPPPYGRRVDGSMVENKKNLNMILYS